MENSVLNDNKMYFLNFGWDGDCKIILFWVQVFLSFLSQKLRAKKQTFGMVLTRMSWGGGMFSIQYAADPQEVQNSVDKRQ